MTDLRDQLADFETAARRLLTNAQPAPNWSKPLEQRALVLVHARPATCHPNRPVNARGLCDSCYQTAWQNGTLTQHPTKRTMRSRDHFVADYELLRSEGYTRGQIAERLRMTHGAVSRAYWRAIRAGALTPDRRKSG